MIPFVQLVSPIRQTKEKSLRATVFFSIEHLRVLHAPRNTVTFDATHFICQLVFRLKCWYKRMQKSRQKPRQKNDPNLRRSIVYIKRPWSLIVCWLSYDNSAYCCWACVQIFLCLERYTNEADGSIQSKIYRYASFVCQTADNFNNSYCDVSAIFN